MKRFASLIFVFIVVFCCSSCGKKDMEDGFLSPVDGVNIVSVDGYSGKFTEDGSDRNVENAVRVTVENVSAGNIQLLNFTVVDSLGRELEFDITTLPAGSTLMCVEKNAAQYSDNLALNEVKTVNCAEFQYDLSLQPDKLLLMCADNCIEVENISDSDYPGGRLHYKDCLNGVYTAGITYSLVIPAIPKGEKTSLSSKHFKDGFSRIVFVVNEV